jgi:HlyD family secretion protein
MMKRTIFYLVAGVLVIAAVVGVVIWQTQSASQADQDVRTTVVERGDMLVAVTASGNIEPEARSVLSFEASGRVAEVPVEMGDVVEAGDVVAQLDTERLTLQLAQAQGALASAEAQLADLENGPRPEEVASAEANLRAAQAQVSASAANRDQVTGGTSAAQIAAAEADLAAAINQQRQAEEAHERTMKCFTVTPPGGEEQTVCPALGTYEEQARYNLQAANENLEAARLRVEELKAGAEEAEVRSAQANVGAAAAQRDASQAQLDLLEASPTAEQLSAAQAQVAQARVSLEQAELALERATLRAPFDGRVARVTVAAGEIVAPGTPAVVLVDPSQFHLTVSVDEIDVGRLAEGQTARVTLDALPQAQLEGMVTGIAPAAELEGGVVYYDVRIDLEPADVPVRADMTANATLVVEELTDVLRIPTWVVRVDRETGQTYVERRTLEGMERVDVELGVRYDGMARVLSGLEQGDVLVLRPDNPLEDSRNFGGGQ